MSEPEPIDFQKIFDQMPEELKRGAPVIEGSYNTHHLNKMELFQFIHENIHDTSAMAIDELNFYELLQQKLHNYLSSSYTLRENFETVLHDIGPDAYNDYKSKFEGTLAEKRIRGLRIFAQHNKPIPIDFDVKDNQDHKIKAILVDVERMERTEDWNQSMTKQFFEIGPEDEKKVVLERAIIDHEDKFTDEFLEWTKERLLSL